MLVACHGGTKQQQHAARLDIMHHAVVHICRHGYYGSISRNQG